MVCDSTIHIPFWAGSFAATVGLPPEGGARGNPFWVIRLAGLDSVIVNMVKFRRLWFRFSLRSLLVALTCVAAAVALLQNHANRQREVTRFVSNPPIGFSRLTLNGLTR